MEGELTRRNSQVPHRPIYCIIAAVCFFSLLACTEQKEHTAAAIYPRDSVAEMTSYGVNTLISDSGVIKYRIVAERWLVNRNLKPSRWIFEKGAFFEQFDEKFHVQSYIQCDTAYYYDSKKLWELRGRVRILTKDGLRFSSEELYWDGMSHELYSNKFSRLVTPDRQLQGSYFRSDERMTKYYVSNTKGSFDKSDMEKSPADTATVQKNDSTALQERQPARPRRRTTNN